MSKLPQVLSVSLEDISWWSHTFHICRLPVTPCYCILCLWRYIQNRFSVNKTHVPGFSPGERALQFGSKLGQSLETMTKHVEGADLPQANVKWEQDGNGGKRGEGRETLGCQDRITPHYSAVRSSKSNATTAFLHLNLHPPSSVKSPVKHALCSGAWLPPDL